jgi:hypothetical protein
MGFFGSLFGSAPQPVGIHGAVLTPLVDGAQRFMQERIASLEASPSPAALRAVYLTLKAQAAVQAAVAPGERAWSRALWLGAMSAEGLLACAHPSPTEVYFEREISVPAATERMPGLARLWREGFQMAVLSGYSEVSERLQSYDITRLRARDAEPNEAELLYMHALQGVFSRAPDLGARLVAAVEEIVQPSASDFILRLLGAEAQCLYAVVSGDAAELRTALVAGLEEHRKYWTKPEHATTAEGLYSLGLSFVARMAKQAGMNVDVRSPYLVF